VQPTAHSEDLVILACVVLTQYRSVTDGQTDVRLDDDHDARSILLSRVKMTEKDLPEIFRKGRIWSNLNVTLFCG